MSEQHYTNDDMQLLENVKTVLHKVGDLMISRFEGKPHLTNLTEVIREIHTNDNASLSILRDELTQMRPAAGWVDDENDGGALPAGEWWVVDPVEGNINHIHGMDDWAITATLVRDHQAVLTAVYLPLTGTTYSAIKGKGAYQDSTRLSVSKKLELNAALVGTGQSRHDETDETYRLMSQSIFAMLQAALVVRVSVPATLQLIHVAAGRTDAFWQHSQLRVGLLAGALLVEEAGGIITDIHGQPWNLSSEDFVAAAPKLHAAVVATLSTSVCKAL